MQPWRSHSNAIHNQRFKKRIELHRQTQPLVAEHRGGTNSRMKRPQPHPPHRRGTFHRRLQPLYTEKHKVSCSGFLPKTEPLQHHAAIPMRSTSTDSKTPYNYTHKHTQSSLKPPLQCGKKKRQTDRSRTRRTDEVPFIAGCSHFTRKNTRFRAPASCPKQSPCNIMQPFQCDLQAQIPKHPITTHTQAHPKQLEATVTMRQKKKANRPQPHPPHRRGTFHRRLQPLYTEKDKVLCSGFLPKTEPLQHHAAIPMRSASTDSKTPYNYAHTSTPKAAWSHRYNAAKKKANRPQPHPPHTVPFIAGCSHFTRKNTRFRAPASSPTQSRCNIMQPFQCDLPPQLQETHRTTHTDTTTRCKTHRRNNSRMKRPQPQPPHSGGTFHRRLQPLYTEKHKVSCSGFLPKTDPLQHHAPLPFMVPSSSLPFFITSLRHHFPSPLPFLTTSLRHHSPSSSFPFFTTSLLHHFPSSPLPFIITSLLHHFPSSPLPFIITSLLHHFPSSPLPFFTTSLRHHSPSSSLPFFTHPVS